MADDDRRVVPKPMVVAGGMSATPEGIADLQARRDRVERESRLPPKTPFSSVMARRRGKSEEESEEELSEKERRQAELPQRGPRPGLAHPGQKEAYGRAEDGDDPVVIKG